MFYISGSNMAPLCSIGIDEGLEHCRALKMGREPVACFLHVLTLCNATQSQAAAMITGSQKQWGNTFKLLSSSTKLIPFLWWLLIQSFIYDFMSRIPGHRPVELNSMTVMKYEPVTPPVVWPLRTQGEGYWGSPVVPGAWPTPNSLCCVEWGGVGDGNIVGIHRSGWVNALRSFIERSLSEPDSVWKVSTV